MSIGNIQRSTRNSPMMQAWLPIALLPVGPKRVNKIPGYSVDTQEIQALQTIHDIFTHVLKPLSDAACQEGYEMGCADGNIRLCFPKLFCWLADHMENATIHGIASNRCPICTTPTEKLGEYADSTYPVRSHASYAMTYGESDALGLNMQGVKNIHNALWSIPSLNPPDLVRADILHNVLLGVLDHMMDWIQGFLEHHDRINAFDYVWRRLPPYHGFTVPSKAYRLITQWSGKEMRNFAKVILGTFTAALHRNSNQAQPIGGQVQEFNRAIQCVRSMTDFNLMTQYDSHTDATVSYMREYLHVFHDTKDVFLRFRAGKVAKRAAAEAHKNLLREQSQVSVTNLTASEKVKMRQENALERRELVDDMRKERAHYNFPKMHVISHDAEQIPKFGALGQYSTEISECMHKGFKDAYRRSNKVNSTSQIVTNYTRDHTFIMKDLTIRTWRQGGQARGPTASVGKRPKDVKMYLRLQGKIDFGTVSNLRDLEQVTGVCAITLATVMLLRREIRDCNIDESRLLSYEVRGYQALEIPVAKFNGEGFVIHNARCTGLKEFRGGRRRSDWIWVRRHPASERG